MAANVVANYATTNTKFGLRTTDAYYILDTNSDISGNLINGNLTITGNASAQDMNCVNLNATVNVVAGNEVQAENVITTGLFSGDGVQNQIYLGEFPDGGVRFDEDQFTNCGVNVSRNYEAAPATARSYFSCECVSGGTLYGYSAFAFQNNGTNVGTFGEIAAVNPDQSIIGTIQINKQNGITLGNSTSATPTVSVVGSGGLGRVYDETYNPPYQAYGSGFITSGTSSQVVSIPGMTTTATVLICAQNTTPMSQGVLSVSNTVNGQFSVVNIDPATGAALNATQNYSFSYLVLPNA